MIRALYTSGWGMLADSKQIDIISNNLANADTTGFKKDIAVSEGFNSVLTKRINDKGTSSLSPDGNVGYMSLGSDVGQIFTNYNQGQLMKTDSKWDLSITGADNAFFTVGKLNENGEVSEYYYTRDGSFSRNADGKLTTRDGLFLLGVSGSPITTSSDDAVVESDGNIYESGAFIDKILMSQFSDTTTLRKFGNNLLRETEQSKKEDGFTGNINTGYLEQSNVTAVNEMIQIINVMRHYEANQKMVQQHDNILDRAVNDIGVVR